MLNPDSPPPVSVSSHVVEIDNNKSPETREFKNESEMRFSGPTKPKMINHANGKYEGVFNLFPVAGNFMEGHDNITKDLVKQQLNICAGRIGHQVFISCLSSALL
jgi:hypothetical protein